MIVCHPARNPGGELGPINYFYINSFKHIIPQWGDVNDIFTLCRYGSTWS